MENIQVVLTFDSRRDAADFLANRTSEFRPWSAPQPAQPAQPAQFTQPVQTSGQIIRDMFSDPAWAAPSCSTGLTAPASTATTLPRPVAATAKCW